MKKNKDATPTPEMAFEEKLRTTLQKPEFKGRVLKYRELYRSMNVSKSTFDRYSGNLRTAQIFLHENPDAPIEVKEFYKNVIDRDYVENSGPKTVIVNNKKHTITKTEIIEKTKTMRMNGNEISKVITPAIVEKTVEATAEEVTIERIRKMYVMAPVGDMPNISKIMKDLGLIDSRGEPTSSVTEEMVRDKMAIDEWRADRSSFLHRSFDLIPEEVKMYRTLGGLELEKKMHQEFSILHNFNQQWFTKGKVSSLDKSTMVDWKPDIGGLAMLAETIRRLANDGPMVAIQINNGGGAPGAPSDSRAAISAGAKVFMQKLNKMTPEELLEEAGKLDSLIKMLAPPEEKITINEINTQEAMSVLEAQKADSDTES